MKIDRLIGILSILLQKDIVTAPELAERFEVSRRTIGRDIDALCRAGIPIQTRQGTNGGISIMENFRMDRTLLTGEEMRDILAGLRSLDSVNGTNRYGQLMEKLSAGSSNFLTGDQSVLIDLSSWYKDSLVSVLCAKGRELADHRALLSDLPLVQLVCLGLVQDAEGFPAVQAEPHGGTAPVREHIYQKAGAPAGSEQ